LKLISTVSSDETAKGQKRTKKGRYCLIRKRKQNLVKKEIANIVVQWYAVFLRSFKASTTENQERYDETGFFVVLRKSKLGTANKFKLCPQ